MVRRITQEVNGIIDEYGDRSSSPARSQFWRGGGSEFQLSAAIAIRN
jgi:hypothetical protein